MPSRASKTKPDPASDYLHMRISPEVKGKLFAIAKSTGMTLSTYALVAMLEKAKRDGHKI
jgi:hypothetical protein